MIIYLSEAIHLLLKVLHLMRFHIVNVCVITKSAYSRLKSYRVHTR